VTEERFEALLDVDRNRLPFAGQPLDEQRGGSGDHDP
jgi:hypothetical protein